MKEELIAKAHWIGQHLHMVSDRRSTDEDDDLDSFNPYEMTDPEAFEEVAESCRNNQHQHHRGSHCFSQSYVVASPQQKKSICVLRSHKGHCSMRKDAAKKSVKKTKKETDSESLGAASEDMDYGEGNGGYDDGGSMDMADDEWISLACFETT